MPTSIRLRNVVWIAALSGIAATGFAGQMARPSATALEMAAYRAMGAKHPDAAVRNRDHLAERLLGPDERKVLSESGSDVVLQALTMDTERAWDSLGVRSNLARAVHVRTRYIDEVLERSLKQGANQVIILGAGLDSRAYRFDDLLAKARVFELDLPATQEYKKKRVAETLGSLPAQVSYVSIDFATQNLGAELNRAGYDANAKTLFVWEGVTMYIPEAAVDATLRFVARSAASGSRIVFDYFLERALRAPTGALQDTTRRVTRLGEPFVFGMAGEDAREFVKQRGLAVEADFAYGELGTRYLPSGRNLANPSVNRICTAVVP